jgi:hypothetical protein
LINLETVLQNFIFGLGNERKAIFIKMDRLEAEDRPSRKHQSKHQALELPAYKRFLRSVGERSWLELFFAAALLAIMAQMIFDYYKSPVFIDPIVVPKTFKDQGYTSLAFTNQVRDEVAVIEFSDKKKVPSMAGRDLPNFEIPEAKVSFRDSVEFLESCLDILPRHISGEVQIPCSSDPKKLMITIEATWTNDGLPAVIKSCSTSDPNEAIIESAKDVLLLVDPAAWGYYLWYIENDIEAADKFSREKLVGPYERWGLLLRGEIESARTPRYLFDKDAFKHYAEADEQFARALAIAPRFQDAKGARAYNLTSWASQLADRGADTGDKEDVCEASRRYSQAVLLFQSLRGNYKLAISSDQGEIKKLQSKAKCS